MKTRPSIAFDSFSGSAGNVTVRKVGDKTYLSSRVKHSKVKTPSQAHTRCRFSDTTRGYSKITEEQRRGWISLAQSLGTYSTSTGSVSMTGHNLFVAINSYRKICGKPQRDSAPDVLKPSHYIALDDLWLTPEHIVFTGLRQSSNPDNVLLFEMYPAASPAECRAWNKTVIVTVKPSTDWGDVDISREVISKFGKPLTIGQKVFIKVCWIDSECGYLKWYTMLGMEVREESQMHREDYVPRAAVTVNDLIDNEHSQAESFDYEMSPGSKLASNDITAKRTSGWSAGCEFQHTGLPNSFDFERSYQWGRATEEYGYFIQCIEVLIQNSNFYKRINLSSRAGIFRQHFETFGTYYVTR